MFKFAVTIPVFIVVASLTRGEPNIVILPNTVDVKIATTSSIEVTNGMNFSLLCKVIDSKSGKTLSDRTLWYKKRLKSRFANVGDFMPKEINNIPDANLSFTKVSTRDQGRYICTSLKYKLVKVLNVVVKPNNFTSEKETSNLRRFMKTPKPSDNSVFRVARAIYDGHNQDFPSFTYSPPDFTFDSKYDTDLHEWLGEKHRNEHYSGYNSYDHDGSNSNDVNSTDYASKLFYLFFGAIAVCIIIYGLSRCCSDDDDTSNTQNSSPRRNRYRPRANIFRNNRTFEIPTSCSHIACIQNRSRHPYADCLLTTDSHILINDHSERNFQNDLDLPPTYADSTANSAASSMQNLNEIDDGFSTRILNSNGGTGTALPPTYEEALINIVLSTPDNTSINDEASEDARNGVDDAGDTGGGYDNSGDTGGDSGGTGGDSGGTGGDSGGTGGDSGDTGGGGGDSGDTGGGSDD